MQLALIIGWCWNIAFGISSFFIFFCCFASEDAELLSNCVNYASLYGNEYCAFHSSIANAAPPTDASKIWFDAWEETNQMWGENKYKQLEKWGINDTGIYYKNDPISICHNFNSNKKLCL